MLAHSIVLGRDGFFNLLRAHGLLVRRRERKAPQTTFSDHILRKYPNLVVGLAITSPCSVWVSDITYILVGTGFGYLSLVTDAYSRMIVGYYLSKSLSAQGCVKALLMALKTLPANYELIHHSDRGCQYCCAQYVEQLNKKTINISMTERSDPRENAIAERVNGILKQEFLEVKYEEYAKAVESVKKAIQIYNYERPHSSVDMLTPGQAHERTGELKQHWKNYKEYYKKEVRTG